MYKDVFAIPCIVEGHDFRCFLTQRPACVFISWCGSIIASRLLTAWCRMFGSQVTKKQTVP